MLLGRWGGCAVSSGLHCRGCYHLAPEPEAEEARYVGLGCSLHRCWRWSRSVANTDRMLLAQKLARLPSLIALTAFGISQPRRPQSSPSSGPHEHPSGA